MLLLHLLFALLWVQTPKPGSVSGTVVNAVTGAPVRKANVVLVGPSGLQTIATDATGIFAFASVLPGDYESRIDSQGFEPTRFPVRIHVNEDQTVELAVVKLMPHGVISGRVRDEDDEPLPHIEVAAMVERYGSKGRTLAQAGLAVTDDRGMYRIFDLPAGRYFLRLSDGSFVTTSNGVVHLDTPEMANVSTWFPGVTESSQAAPSELAAGSELTLDLRMKRARVFHIRGHVAGAVENAGQANLMFELAGSTGERRFTAIRRGGTFDASGIMAGVWHITIRQPGEDKHILFARQTVIVTDHDVNDAALALAPLAEVRVQSQFDAGASGKPPEAFVQLASIDDADAASVRTNADGTATLTNVVPGASRAMVTSLGDAYLKAVRWNGVDAPGGVIPVTPGGGLLTLVLAKDAGSLSGRVEGPDAIVTITSASVLQMLPSAWGVRNGTFNIGMLPPGDYRVYAWEMRDAGFAQYPEFIKLFESRGAAVTIHAGGHETVTLTAIPAAEIEIAKGKLQ